MADVAEDPELVSLGCGGVDAFQDHGVVLGRRREASPAGDGLVCDMEVRGKVACHVRWSSSPVPRTCRVADMLSHKTRLARRGTCSLEAVPTEVVGPPYGLILGTLDTAGEGIGMRLWMGDGGLMTDQQLLAYVGHFGSLSEALMHGDVKLISEDASCSTPPPERGSRPRSLASYLSELDPYRHWEGTSERAQD